MSQANNPNAVARRPAVTLHVVSSLDGFIAKHDNDVSWLDSSGDVYEKGVSEEGSEEVVESIDCFVLGSRTYETALQLGWPYGDTPTVVVTHRELQSTRNSVECYSGDLRRLVEERLARGLETSGLLEGRCCARAFWLGLVDQIRLSIVPVLLGDGLPLFGNSGTEKRWRLKNVNAYKNGIVELWYESRPITS